MSSEQTIQTGIEIAEAADRWLRHRMMPWGDLVEIKLKEAASEDLPVQKTEEPLPPKDLKSVAWTLFDMVEATVREHPDYVAASSEAEAQGRKDTVYAEITNGNTVYVIRKERTHNSRTFNITKTTADDVSFFPREDEQDDASHYTRIREELIIYAYLGNDKKISSQVFFIYRDNTNTLVSAPSDTPETIDKAEAFIWDLQKCTPKENRLPQTEIRNITSTSIAEMREILSSLPHYAKAKYQQEMNPSETDPFVVFFAGQTAYAVYDLTGPDYTDILVIKKVPLEDYPHINKRDIQSVIPLNKKVREEIWLVSNPGGNPDIESTVIYTKRAAKDKPYVWAKNNQEALEGIEKFKRELSTAHIALD